MIWALDMNWEPYPPPKLRTSPIPQAVRCGQSLQRLSPAERAGILARTFRFGRCRIRFLFAKGTRPDTIASENEGPFAL